MMQSPTLQVRQHIGHKRTFFYLEQLVLKFNADAQCINIKDVHGVSHLMSPAFDVCMDWTQLDQIPFAPSHV